MDIHTGAPHGDTLGMMYPLSNISFNYSFRSTIFGVLIRHGALDIGTYLDNNSIEKSITLLEEILGSLQGKHH